MFTGIVEELGTIAVARARMNIRCSRVLEDTREGSSIAVNGVCLTATKVDPTGFWCDLSPETLSRTSLGDLREGSRVNLERAAAVGDRLSGHIVQGHVDGTAEFLSLDPLPDGNWWLKVRVPADLDRYDAFIHALVELIIDKYDGSLKAEHGTGIRARALGRPVGGKTGTTNDFTDAWFIGLSRFAYRDS